MEMFTQSFRKGDKVVPVGAPVDASFDAALTIQAARKNGYEALTVIEVVSYKRYRCEVNGVTDIYRQSDLRLATKN